MRPIIFLSLVVLALIVAGCSGGGNVPITPQPDSTPEQIADANNHELAILASGTMNLEDGTIEASEHSASAYMDVTGFVGSNFSFTIDNFIPPDILEITLKINNVSPYTVYDACIVFENLYGKKVLNPDSYMDIFGPWDLDPFIAFRKEDPNRVFPLGIDTEPLEIQYSGGNTLVDYFIIADLAGNTGGVLALTDWNVAGQLTPDGGNATIEVTALDHQENVTGVYADTSALTGANTTFLATADPLVWTADITNSELAPEGTYIIPTMAVSPSTPAYQTYKFFELEVVDVGEARLITVEFYEKPVDDVWFDVGVEPQGFVYVVADHPETDNVGGFPDTGSRTCLKFTNNLDTMVVLNEGDVGMNNPYPGAWNWDPNFEWDRVDVSDGGNLLTNIGGSTLATWEVSGSVASNVACCWQYNCYPTNTVGNVPDVSDINPMGYGPSLFGLGRISDVCPSVFTWDIAFKDTNLLNSSESNLSGDEVYPKIGVVGIEGLSDTLNMLVFFSDGTEGKLSVFGDCFSQSGTADEISSVGTYGTGNGEFMGGLDISINSKGDIFTLEDHGGTYRFQKFDSDFIWIYSSPWICDGEPLRMDWDTSTDKLYMVSTVGLYLMEEVE
ncbi:hypothetical protein J7L05_12400 [bacterium]|nr:hypothetical protein [bacterium]